MSRFTDTAQLHHAALLAVREPPILSAAGAKPAPVPTGLFARIEEHWTKWVQRRHLRNSVERLGALSDHLLDDVGLAGSAKSDMTIDADS